MVTRCETAYMELLANIVSKADTASGNDLSQIIVDKKVVFQQDKIKVGGAFMAPYDGLVMQWCVRADHHSNSDVYPDYTGRCIYAADERPSPTALRRSRRRCPRSQESLLRRYRPRSNLNCRQPQDGGLCESKPVPTWSNFCLTILNLSVRGFLTHKIELEIQLNLLCYPLLVGMIETFLTASTLHPALHNYTLVSRFDR